jgi:O-antigen ligase
MNAKSNSSKSQLWALAAVLVFAIAFGGGGSKYGMANMLVQLAALAALAFNREAFFEFWKSAPFALKALTGLSILLPALYLVPLPQSVWSTLPGRDLMAQSYELVGREGWASASVEPLRTLLALTALIVPLALLTIGWSASRERLVQVGWIAVALGLVNMLIGIPQVLTNSEVGVLYPENPMPGVLFGTFANRNSTGLFLVGTLALAALLPALPQFRRQELLVRAGACALLLVAIMLTRSRTALVLALLPLGLVGLRVLIARTTQGKSGLWVALGGIALIAGTGAIVAVAAPGRVGAVLERFDDADTDARAYIWEDAVYSADRFWPLGSGTGTFDDVFQLDESLENLTLRRAGRAHNDYLEVAIEAGIPGLTLVAAWILLLGWLAWRARRSSDRWVAWSGGAALLAIALQSITDYPLRNLSLLGFAGFALLILVRFGSSAREDRP